MGSLLTIYIEGRGWLGLSPLDFPVLSVQCPLSYSKENMKDFL